MKPTFDNLLPNITGDIISKILVVEVYFLLRSGKSPAYFSLVDFIDSYSIELLYISVLFYLLQGWIILPALAIYSIAGGSLDWIGRRILGLYKSDGIPVFTALSQHERENSVAISVAKKYAKSNDDNELQVRILEYETSSQKSLSHEALAVGNTLLIFLMTWITYSTGAPNFLMQVAKLFDPFTFGNGYKTCLVLFAIQSLLGRASSFHLLRASGNLPPEFFRSNEEREKVAAWTNSMIEQYKPSVQKWLKKVN